MHEEYTVGGFQNTSRDYRVSKFIGNNSEYYMGKFAENEGKTIKGINGAAFLGLFWMLYRKMYIEAAVFMVLSYAMTYVSSASGLLLTIGIMLVANTLYAKKIERNLKKVENLSDAEAGEILAKKGGTSVAAVVILGIVYGALLMLNILIFAVA